MNRRFWLERALATAGAAMLGACERISQPVRDGLSVGAHATQAVQRFILNRRALAREYLVTDIAPSFKANGSKHPIDPDYRAHAEQGFRDWRLVIDGLVETPLALSMEDLRAAPTRTQITRHDCVEGWSAIGKWQGARLGALLDRAGLKPEANFIVFHCADNVYDRPGEDKYYESVDLVDAYHEQTILAYALNDAALPVEHGAPIRLRVERQLGYKHAKYIMRIEAVASFAHCGRGKGGYWEDRGYEWYAGI
jgi:DMSO/TMAO reductase YedYZ molybdopterin-dependent catalytic subunit